MVQTDSVYEFSSGFVVSWADEYEVVDCLRVGDLFFFVIACLAPVGFGLVDSVKIYVQREMPTSQL